MKVIYSFTTPQCRRISVGLPQETYEYAMGGYLTLGRQADYQTTTLPPPLSPSALRPPKNENLITILVVGFS